MCLIVIAHRASPRFPLVIAANRDEAYSRPAIAAEFWDDDPDIAGGRDLLHDGTWLAMTRAGRWAAVTNLRGSDRSPESRSRGALVAGFVRASAAPSRYLETLAFEASQFGGFHLLAGDAREVSHLASAERRAHVLADGVHAFSNAQPGVDWPKMMRARETMQSLIASTDAEEVLAAELLRFLTTPSNAAAQRGSTAMNEVELDPFIIGEQYGTRSSTTIVIDGQGRATFREKRFGAGGVPLGEAVLQFEVS